MEPSENVSTLTPVAVQVDEDTMRFLQAMANKSIKTIEHLVADAIHAYQAQQHEAAIQEAKIRGAGAAKGGKKIDDLTPELQAAYREYGWQVGDKGWNAFVVAGYGAYIETWEQKINRKP